MYFFEVTSENYWIKNTLSSKNYLHRGDLMGWHMNSMSLFAKDKVILHILSFSCDIT